MDILNKIKIYSCSNKCKLYAIGGYVRDKILNLNHNGDVDLIFDGDINKLIKNLKEKGYSIFQIKKDMNIYRCTDDKKNQVDISYIEGNKIEDDLKSRDFTINAIALDLINNIIVDPFKGCKDLQKGIIRKVNNNSIRDDTIRILRAIRFVIKYNFYIDVEIKKDIKKYNKEIVKSPKERLFNEFMKIISEDSTGIAYALLLEYDILNILILNSVHIYHKVNRSEHINMIYKLYKKITNNNLIIKGFKTEKLKETVSGFYIKDYISVAIILNSFMYDLDNDIKYELSRKFCKENKFPNKATNIICSIIKGIKYPEIIFNNKYEERYIFFKEYNDVSIYILLNMYCEIYSNYSLGYIQNELFMRYKDFIEEMINEKKRYNIIIHNKIINGKEVKDILKIEGSDIGNTLEYINRLRYYKKLNNREEILSFLKQGNFKL